MCHRTEVVYRKGTTLPIYHQEKEGVKPPPFGNSKPLSLATSRVLA